jgi:TnpA family transposase
VPIEKVVTKEVEKIITKEVPVYIDRIIEKINRVEVPTEVYKEVYREVSKNDRIREAHEYLFGMIRSQNTSKALEIYHEEASK